MKPHPTKYAASRYQPMPGEELFIDIVPADSRRFLTLGACKNCGDDALCNYVHELGAAFCGPKCVEEFKEEYGHA